MSARDLAAMIEAIWKPTPAETAGPTVRSRRSRRTAARSQQLQGLAQKTDQLQKDTDALQSEMASIRSNLQMSAILPLLMNQYLDVVSDTTRAATPPVP